MNRKISSNMSIILLLIILGLSYAYMNLPDNFKLSMTGGGNSEAIPGECIPMMYKFRYLFYFFLIFMIAFVIRGYMIYTTVIEYSFSDYIKNFLNQWAKNVTDAKAKTISENDSLIFDLVKTTFSEGEYATYGNAFCTLVSPCDCCNEPGYQHPSCSAGTAGYIKPGTPSAK
jgi:hypothetical protein